MRILLIGPYPPPYGGMSVQIQRWRHLLTEVYRHECLVLGIGEFRTKAVEDVIPVLGYFDFIEKLCKFAKRRYILHLVTNGHGFKSWLSALACGLAGAMNKNCSVLVFGSGNAPQYLQHANVVSKVIIRLTIGVAGKIICRNEAMRDALIAKGAQPDRVVILPGFLVGKPSSDDSLPETIKAFLETHGPILGVTVSVPHSGVLPSEYGIDEVVQALKSLRQDYPRIGLVIIGASASARSQIHRIEEVWDDILFTEPIPQSVVLSVVSKLTVFVRPTYTDGDSNSVREALALGVPVVASKTDFRPEGVVTFRKGDAADLVAQLEHTLSHLEEAVSNIQQFGKSDNETRLLNIYKELLADRRQRHYKPQQDANEAKKNES